MTLGQTGPAEEGLDPAPPVLDRARRPDAARVGRTVGRFGTVIGLFLLCAFFSIKSQYFLTKDNLLGILNASAVNGIIASGLTVTLVLLEFDLSVAYVANLAGMLGAGLSRDYGVGPAFLIAIA